ncbi:MAG: hypothetical protein ACRDHZ_20720, partial [Ktedonobacteraceae bacterium]
MATWIPSTLLPSAREPRLLVGKWVIALLIPLLVFTFAWNGEAAVNQILVGFFLHNSVVGSHYDYPTLIGALIFFVLFYATLTAFVGYIVAADSSKQNPLALWISMLVFTVVPLLLISITDDLFIGLSFSVVVWLLYFLVLTLWRKFRPRETAPAPPRIKALSSEQQEGLLNRAIAGGFWFGTIFAVISLVVDLAYFFTGSYGTSGNFLLIWIVARTLLLPFFGYFLGRLGGTFALRLTLKANGNTGDGQNAENSQKMSKRFTGFSMTRAREKAHDFVPNDLPLSSSGARNFYLLLLFAFLLLYPMLDPFLFGGGTAGRLANYGDAGRYVILALGLNIVVGFAGLLDLGYVAFFVFGAYTWGIIGSPKLTALTGILIDPN